MVALRSELSAANGELSSGPPGQATQWRVLEAEAATLRVEVQAERSRSRISDRDRDELRECSLAQLHIRARLLREYLARQKEANAELKGEFNAAVVTSDAQDRAHSTVVSELERKISKTDLGSSDDGSMKTTLENARTQSQT